MAERSLFEQLSKGIADAVADIREKVVEEPLWGRTVTERESADAPHWPEARQPEPFGSSTHTRDIGQEPEQAQDKEIDR